MPPKDSLMCLVWMIELFLGGIVVLLFNNSNAYSSGIMSGMMLFIISILILLVKFIFGPKKCRKTYNLFKNYGDLNNVYDFYDDYFVINSNRSTAKISYSEIENIKEYDDVLILADQFKRGYVISKENCSPSDVSFIKNIISHEKIKASQRFSKRENFIFVLFTLLIFIFIIQTCFMIAC